MGSDIKLKQDSYLQIIGTVLKDAGGKLNVIIVDNRSGVIDGRSIEESLINDSNKQRFNGQKEIVNTGRKLLPKVSAAEAINVDSSLVESLEQVLRNFPQPRLPNVMKAIFKIAAMTDMNDGRCAKWLGVTYQRFTYWKNKFNIK